jgi:hypothetical protein
VVAVGALVLLVIAVVLPGRNDDSSGVASGVGSADECANEGGSLRRWVSLDGSQIFAANPHLAGVNEIVVCGGSGRPVSVNGQPYKH